jgi:dTDP-3-amino-3,4,6-trideoxy-alpha-D-glucose transaminase
VDSTPLVDLHAQYESMRADIDAAIERVLHRQVFLAGPETRAFEIEFAAFAQAKEAVAVSSGTSALELALWVLGVGAGDEVILPAWTFWATSEAILRQGAIPVFVDVTKDDWTLDPRAVGAAVTERTKAIVPVHIFGHPADVRAIKLAAPGVAIVEDAAQAQGARYHGAAVGSEGTLSTYSFYPSKNLGAYGDAGAIVTNDQELAVRLRAIRDHGSVEKYTHLVAGTNARCDELQAAVLRAKLPKLRDWTSRRQELAALYETRLAGTIRVQVTQPWAEHVRHLFVVAADHRETVVDRLRRAGIHAGVHYPAACHQQPAWQGDRPRLPVTEALADTVLSLPLYPELGESGVERVCEALLAAIDSDVILEPGPRAEAGS